MRRLIATLIIASSLLFSVPVYANDEVEQVPLVAPIALTPAQAAASYWYYLHTLPADQLIRVVWAGTGQEERATAIAWRESRLNCSAKNRRSSATGLFQTLRLHNPRAERLGLSWDDVRGPDCVADALLAFDLWKEQGWRPWRLTR